MPAGARPRTAGAITKGVIVCALSGLVAAVGPVGSRATEPAEKQAAVSRRLIVRGRSLPFDDTVDDAVDEGEAALTQLRERVAALGLTRVGEIAALDAVVYRAPLGEVDRAVAQLRGVPGVIGVERDVAVRAHPRSPDDERFGDQWGLQRIGAPSAWDTTTGSGDVTIAVLDTGVDAGHPELADKVDALGSNLTLDGLPTDTADHNGHGTASAGVAAADSDNGAGIAGVCWQCRVLPVKVLGDDGSGLVSNVAAGVVYAVETGADVVSLSLGARSHSTLLDDAVTYAAQRGVLVVASAGNYGSREQVYPAALDDVVGVVASTRTDTRYDFSSFGSWAEIAAPGCNPATDLGGGYKQYCGTSSAAPVVAGVAGLAQSADPQATVGQLRTALREGAAAFEAAQWGRVDAPATLAALRRTEPDGLLEDPVPDPGLDDRLDLDPGEEYESGPGVVQHRISGANRFATAARLSAEAFAEEGLLDGLLGGLLGSGVERAYLTSGQTFADALPAGAAAGDASAPVLLTARDALPAPTARELARLGPDEVVVVGGASAVSEGVAEAAGDAAEATTRRVAGADRFATAAQVARERFGEATETAYVATGTDYADALAGVPAAVDAAAPMLLTAPDRLPPPVAAALEALTPQRIVVLGGTGAVSRGVVDELAGLAGDGGVERIAGADRFATAAAIARGFPAAEEVSAYLATGTDFPDALAAGPVAGLEASPLLLVTRDQLPEASAQQLRRLHPDANVIMGGTTVIRERVQTGAADASTAGADGS